METSEASSAAGSTRRTVLKIGAGVGIGAAMWNGPQIGVLGVAPAHALECSVAGAITSYPIPSEETNQSCPTGSFQWRTNNAPPGFVFNPPINGSCSDQERKTTITSPTGQRCKVQLSIIIPAGGGTLIYDQPISGIGTVTFPAIPGVAPLDNVSASARLQLTLKCVPAGQCFPEEVQG